MVLEATKSLLATISKNTLKYVSMTAILSVASFLAKVFVGIQDLIHETWLVLGRAAEWIVSKRDAIWAVTARKTEMQITKKTTDINVDGDE